MKSFASTTLAVIALFSSAAIAMPQMGGPLQNGMSGGMMPGQGQPQGMPNQPMQQGQQFPQNPQNPQMQNPGQIQGQPMVNDPNNAAIQTQNGVQLPAGAMPTNQQQQFGIGNPALNTQMNGASSARGSSGRQGVVVIGAAVVAAVALMI